MAGFLESSPFPVCFFLFLKEIGNTSSPKHVSISDCLQHLSTMAVNPSAIVFICSSVIWGLRLMRLTSNLKTKHQAIVNATCCHLFANLEYVILCRYSSFKTLFVMPQEVFAKLPVYHHHLLGFHYPGYGWKELSEMICMLR